MKARLDFGNLALFFKVTADLNVVCVVMVYVVRGSRGGQGVRDPWENDTISQPAKPQ